MDHVTCLLFTTRIRMDEYHPCHCRWESRLHLLELWETSIQIPLSIPILNVIANYKRQYPTLYQLKSSHIAKYVRRDVDVNHGYTSCIYPNHNPLSKSLMLYGQLQVVNYCISPNHGKHSFESYGTLLMHLSESCVRKIVLCFTIHRQHCSSSDHMLIKWQLN